MPAETLSAPFPLRTHLLRPYGSSPQFMVSAPSLFPSYTLSSSSPPSLLTLIQSHSILITPRSSIVLGVIYLAFQAFPIIFEDNHGFNMQCTGLTFSGIGLGMILALCSQPYWNAYVTSSNLPNTYILLWIECLYVMTMIIGALGDTVNFMVVSRQRRFSISAK